MYLGEQLKSIIKKNRILQVILFILHKANDNIRKAEIGYMTNKTSKKFKTSLMDRSLKGEDSLQYSESDFNSYMNMVTK